MRKFTLQVIALMMLAACSNPVDSGTGDGALIEHPGDMPEVTDTTIAVPTDTGAKSGGTTGYFPGVNTVTGDTMTRYIEHTTGFSGEGVESQIEENGDNQNNQNNQNNRNNQNRQ